jgi:hypothetical protein
MNNERAWLSFMRYTGCLTYAEGSNELQIPNLTRYNLQLEDVEEGLKKIATQGDISQFLGCYERLMSKRDVGFKDFEKTEEQHRDSIFWSLFRNPLLKSRVEFRVTKVRRQFLCEVQPCADNNLTPSHVHRRKEVMGG